MKFTATALFVASCMLESTDAFAPILSTSRSAAASQPQYKNLLRMSSTNAEDEIAKLRAAAAAAREDAARLSKELGKEDPAEAAANAIVAPTKSKDEITDAIRAIDFGSDAQTQITALDGLRTEGNLQLYKSATVDAGSGDLRSFDVSLQTLQSRSGLTSETLGIGEEEVSLDDFKYATLWVTGICSVLGVAALAFLPENIGATICYLVAVIPILFLAVGSTAPAIIANAIAGFKSPEDQQNKADRVCCHEAAHFLCGYLCGLPIANYVTTDENVPRVEFFDTRDGMTMATAQQGLTEDQVNALTVVAMSGAVAEAMRFGKAQGSANDDLMQLEMVFRRSDDFLGAEKQQDLTRWGALTAYRLLTMHKNKLDALIEAFNARKPIAECVAILEQ